MRIPRTIHAVVCLVILMAASLFAGFQVYKYNLRTIYLKQSLLGSKEWNSRVSDLNSQLLSEDSVVLLGDSLSARFPAPLLTSMHITNFGVDGDFTSTLLTRMQPFATVPPKRIFLMIGINDILARTPPNKTFINYELIVEWILKHCPQTQLHVQSCLPTSFQSGMFANNREANDDVIALNRFLKDFCDRERVDYVDLYSHFVSDRELPKHLTTDGIHLNENGYRLWWKRIEIHIETQLGADHTPILVH